MPDQVIPITDLASVGLIEDTPSVSLPPNAFSDLQNIRFHDGAIRKQPGETTLLNGTTDLFPGTELAVGTNIDYVAYWPAPSGRKYVVISGTNVLVYNVDANGLPTGTGPTIADTITAGGTWQHTLFNGGFHIIFNNGTSTPFYLQDDSANAIDLPGWDSYAAEEVLMNFESDGSSGFIEVPATLASGTRIKISNIPRNTADPIYTETVITGGTDTAPTLADGTLAEIGTITMVSATGFRFTPFTATGGNTFRIAIVSDPVTAVTAGVIRAYGNLLVAGNLRETGGRTLTGTIRTSDVAGPGEIPLNWNPFQIGVNTADEFILASTGTITEMAELQGVLYVYTDSSIHSIQQTGSPIVPFQIAPITENYGAHNTDSVIEVDGKHIVYGSSDVYIFAGHPGSISSIADGRVRDAFRRDSSYRITRYNAQDELWFWRRDVPTIYIWNYRLNVWTKRIAPAVTEDGLRAIDGIPDGLIQAGENHISILNESSFLSNAWFERHRLAMTPEFDTETLVSMALLVDGSGMIDVQAEGSNAPGATPIDFAVAATGDSGDFDISDSYKKDIRVHGRFLNYRLTHSGTTEMNLTGMQFDISKGGQR